MDSELERFKTGINLTEYLASQGYERDARESSRGSIVMRHAATGDKVVVRRNPNQHWVYFSVRDDNDNGTILDYVMLRRGLSLGQVRRELRPWIGTAKPQVRIEAYCPEVPEQGTDLAAVEAAWAAALEVESSVYLNTRGLRREILSDWRIRGTWREDARKNALFAHTDGERLTGYEVKNRDWTAFAASGTRSLWRSKTRSDDTRLVFTESAIDALSYHALKPDPSTRYASTGGTLGKIQCELLREAIAVMPEGAWVVLAFDNDGPGERAAATVRELVPGVNYIRAAPKSAKDWNEVLERKEEALIREVVGAHEH